MTRTPEDALRDVLHGAGDDPIAGGSFDDVRARARRLDRRSRLLKAGGAAVVLLAVVGISIPLLDDGDGTQQRVITEPEPDGRKPAPVSSDAQGIWPFANAAEADNKDIELPFNPTDAVATARTFLMTVGGMSEPMVLNAHDEDGRVVEVVADKARRRTTVVLSKLGSSDRWTVIAARSDGLSIIEPAPAHGQTVGSPLTVFGQATAFEGTVLVRVIDRNRTPNELGRAILTGEMGEMKDYRGDVRFELDVSGLGAVIAWTDSAEDGSVEQVAAVPITWSSPDGAQAAAALPAGKPLADDEIVTVLTVDVSNDPDDQQIVVLDANDGSIRRRLGTDVTIAEGGVLDLEVSADRRTVLVALSTSACDSLVRAFAADGSGASDLGDGERVALSPDGRRLAVVVDQDCDDQDTIEVRDLAGRTATRRFGDDARATSGLPADAGNEFVIRVNALTWADDETIIHDAHYEDGVALQVLAADGSVDRRLQPPDGETWSMPTRPFDDTIWVVAKCCGSDPSKILIKVLEIDTMDVLGQADYDVTTDVSDYTGRNGVFFWVTPDVGLHSSASDKLLRADVVLVAS